MGTRGRRSIAELTVVNSPYANKVVAKRPEPRRHLEPAEATEFDLRDAMRGEDQRSEVLFSYVRLESRIPADHPLRAIRTLIDEALNGLSRDFNKLYARDGRPSIPPER